MTAKRRAKNPAESPADLAGLVRNLLEAVRARPIVYVAVSVAARGDRDENGKIRQPGVQDLLIEGAGTPCPDLTERQCELLERIWHPGPMWFVQFPAKAERLLTAVLAEVSPKVSDNDARDEFIYESRKKGKSLDWIRHQVNQRKSWEKLTNQQGVSQAAKRYAERKGLPWPIPR